MYAGENAPDPLKSFDIEGPVPRTIREASELIEEKIDKTYRIVGFKRILVYQYPVTAIREALVNAVAHRDYAITGATTRIEIFPDRICIASPGLLPQPLTLAKIRRRKYRPVSRNPVIARVLSFFEDIEERGRGIKRIHNRCLDHGLKAPAFDYSNGYFVVTIFAPKSIDEVRFPQDATGFEITPSIIENLNQRQKDLLKLLLNNGRITNKELQIAYNVSKQAIQNDLNELIQLNVIQKRGKAQNIYYILAQSEKIDK